MTKEPEKEFKYATEAGLTFRIDKFALLQRDEFTNWESSPNHSEYIEHCNIYFICQRNRVGYQPSSLKVSADSILMYFEFWEGVERYPFPIQIRNRFGTIKLSIESEAPYKYFKIKNDETGETVYEAKATYFVDDYKAQLFPRPDFLDFEVLYIGQAMDNSKKPTFNRLIKHEKLEEIYSVCNPDKEIFLFLFPLFSVDGMVEIINSKPSQEEHKEKDIERLKKFLETKLILTHEQQVSATEAAFIRYFNPKYNTHHTTTFPSKRVKDYNELYKLDLNTISIQLDTRKQNVYFYNENAPANSFHSKSFYLPTETDRRKMFDFSE